MSGPPKVLSRACSQCKLKRRLREGLCADCGGFERSRYQIKASEVLRERSELRRLHQGLEHTRSLPTQDGAHATHRAHLILVAGCRACSAIGHRLPPQNWTGA